MINEVFLLVTAIVFTLVGMWMQRNNEKDNVNQIIESTIDRLIADGYINSRINDNGDLELLKHYEE
jgi:hypothetical protein